MSKSFHSNTG